jgi:SpoU rRNA methylase family enzyme
MMQDYENFIFWLSGYTNALKVCAETDREKALFKLLDDHVGVLKAEIIFQRHPLDNQEN